MDAPEITSVKKDNGFVMRYLGGTIFTNWCKLASPIIEQMNIKHLLMEYNGECLFFLKKVNNLNKNEKLHTISIWGTSSKELLYIHPKFSGHEGQRQTNYY